jgi:hypothetical protein
MAGVYITDLVEYGAAAAAKNNVYRPIAEFEPCRQLYGLLKNGKACMLWSKCIEQQAEAPRKVKKSVHRASGKPKLRWCCIAFMEHPGRRRVCCKLNALQSVWQRFKEPNINL